MDREHFGRGYDSPLRVVDDWQIKNGDILLPSDVHGGIVSNMCIAQYGVVLPESRPSQ
jgi:hypothetical protein